MDKEKMIKAARVIKTGCSSLENEDCCVKEVGCPFQVSGCKYDVRGCNYGCILKLFPFPCDWTIPNTLDEWISRFDNGDADTLSKLEQVEIKELLVELKESRKEQPK